MVLLNTIILQDIQLRKEERDDGSRTDRGYIQSGQNEVLVVKECSSKGQWTLRSDDREKKISFRNWSIP